ncbi:hypothetical protein [Nocardia tengchongensis]|uniref:hypothetical protein n=1 Tax=Nocardia tengchongensis TaxID=2055889 RepID=UPI003693EBCA
MNNTRIRRAGIGITGFAMVAAMMIGAPSASADLSGNSVTVASNSHYANQTYTITADVSSVASCWMVWFYDGNTAIIPPGENAPGVLTKNNAASVQWTPTTTGTHTITAVAMANNGGQNVGLGPVNVQVTTAPAGGTDTGSADSIPVIGGILKTLGL